MNTQELVCYPTCASNLTFSMKRFHIDVFEKISIFYFVALILWTLTKAIDFITNIVEKSSSVSNMCA